MKLWKKEIKLLLILFKFLIEIILIFIFEIVKKYLITKNIKKRIIILVLN
jgi:ribosome biogenesis GTPase A